MTAFNPPREVNRRQCLARGVIVAGSCFAPAIAISSPKPVQEMPLLCSDGQIALPAEPVWPLTYIDFWASWCAPCVVSFQWMNAMHDRWSGKGLRIVAINLDRRAEDGQRFLRQNPARFATAFDTSAQWAKALNVTAMPAAFLIDRKRQLLQVVNGFKLQDTPSLEAKISKSLSNLS
jgi:thiol-disulfide isomerase/thioredoxin